MKHKILLITALLCMAVQGVWAAWDRLAHVPIYSPGDRAVIIKSLYELEFIRNNWENGCGEYSQLYGDNRDFCQMDYILNADLDVSFIAWTPLSTFTGKFNGNGHTIRISIWEATDNYQGLFEEIGKGGEVKNLHVAAYIHCKSSRLVGGICGQNDGTIENCWVSGTVRSDWQNSSVSVKAKVGGICGENNGTVQYCCVTANVQNNDAHVGGLVGCNDGTLKHCTFYGERISTHDQASIYSGNSDNWQYCYGVFNQSEYNAASGKDMYRKAIRYTYDVAVKTEGRGTVRTCADNEYNVSGTRNGETFTLDVTSGTVHSVTITDADGNDVSLQGHANDWSSFWFTMPKKNVTVTVVFGYTDWPTEGAGTEDSPYIISSADDWYDFAHNVKLGRSYSGKVIKLDNDISVSTSVGSYQSDDNYQPFSGIFDGYGNMLTINLSNQSRFAAPFKCVEGATIKNLRTAGTINGTGNADGKLLAGLVGVSFGNTTITGCRSSVTLTTDFGTDAAMAGFVAGTKGGSLTISGCVFDGSMTGSSNTRCAGIAGYEYTATTTKISNCLFAPATLTVSIADDGYTKTISRDADATLTNCYYTQALGTAQGTQCILAASIPTNLGSPTAEYGMVTAYQNGLLFNGTFYGAFTTFSLANTGNNTSTITNNDGYLANVTLTDRTLYKDGAWNTICLPFNVTISGSPLDGAVARPLTSASISGSTLNLTFSDAVTTLQAGTPYIIKWSSAAVTGSNTAISGSESSYGKLVDGNVNTYVSRCDLPWECVFKTASFVNLKGYTLHPYDVSVYPDRRPYKWTLEAKANEGDAWTTIDSRDVTANSGDALPNSDVESQVYDIAAGKQGNYQYFRFKVSESGGVYMNLRELKLYGDLFSPVFNGVTIDATDRSFSSGSGDARVRFLGTYKSTTFTAGDATSVLLLGLENKLHYAGAGAGLGAQRAYFKIGEDGASQARSLTGFNIDFGDSEKTGIISTTNYTNSTNSDAWYDMQGRKLDGKPTTKGIYVNGNRKVVINN